MSIKKISSLSLVGVLKSEARQNYSWNQNVAFEQGEASTGIVEVATGALLLELNEFKEGKKLEHKQ